MYVFFVEHVGYIIMYIFRLIKEITCCEYERLKRRDVEVSMLMKEELKKGKSNPCPLNWQKKAVDALHEGAEAFMVGILQLASYPHPVGNPPAPGYTAGKKNKRRP